uniref:Uncharacterized protein n=1 Tax=Anguilla anguilla TaxID=7936 RepID=A0A0E9SVF8_ANGAN
MCRNFTQNPYCVMCAQGLWEEYNLCRG